MPDLSASRQEERQAGDRLEVKLKSLKEFRKDRGLTQAELAQHVGISYQQIQKYEKGKDNPSVGMRLKIAKALDLLISEVLTEEELDNIRELIEKEIERKKNDLLVRIRELIRPGPMDELPEDVRQLARNIQDLPLESRNFIITTTTNLIEEFKKRP